MDKKEAEELKSKLFNKKEIHKYEISSTKSKKL